MSDKSFAGPWVRRFLLEHVVAECNLARNTQGSYRDMFSLLLPYVSEQAHKPVDRLAVEEIAPEVVRSFLIHLEQNRGCTISTRNQRLAAIHAWARYIARHSPEHVAWGMAICDIPFKRAPKPSLPYLEKPEMDALLQAPDKRTPQGQRDYALLLFLYNSGARADEAARVSIGDLDLGSSPSVRIWGKGRKERPCPLWTLTADILRPLITARPPSERVFLNRRRQPMTRYGVHAMVERHVVSISEKMPSLKNKQISPHTIRHTCAVHLLRAGVDINTIRAWLGHVSVDTTNIYAEVDLTMKAAALAHCEISSTAPVAQWRNNQGVIAFLRTL